MPLIRISAEGEAKGAIIELPVEANFEEVCFAIADEYGLDIDEMDCMLDVTGSSTQENITIHTNPVWLLWWQDVGAGVDPKALCNATLRLALRPPRRSRRFGGTASTSAAPAASAAPTAPATSATSAAPAAPSSSHAGDEPMPELEAVLGTRPGAVAPPPSPPAPQTTTTPAPAPATQASAAPASKEYTPELIARMMNAEPKGPRNWNTIWMNGTVEQDRRDHTDAIKSSTDGFFDTGEVAASLPGFLLSIGIVDEDGLRNVTRSNEMREHIEKDTERLRAKSSRQNVPWFNRGKHRLTVNRYIQYLTSIGSPLIREKDESPPDSTPPRTARGRAEKAAQRAKALFAGFSTEIFEAQFMANTIFGYLLWRAENTRGKYGHDHVSAHELRCWAHGIMTVFAHVAYQISDEGEVHYVGDQILIGGLTADVLNYIKTINDELALGRHRRADRHTIDRFESDILIGKLRMEAVDEPTGVRVVYRGMVILFGMFTGCRPGSFGWSEAAMRDFGRIVKLCHILVMKIDDERLQIILTLPWNKGWIQGAKAQNKVFTLTSPSDTKNILYDLAMPVVYLAARDLFVVGGIEDIIKAPKGMLQIKPERMDEPLFLPPDQNGQFTNQADSSAKLSQIFREESKSKLHIEGVTAYSPRRATADRTVTLEDSTVASGRLGHKQSVVHMYYTSGPANYDVVGEFVASTGNDKHQERISMAAVTGIALHAHIRDILTAEGDVEPLTSGLSQEQQEQYDEILSMSKPYNKAVTELRETTTKWMKKLGAWSGLTPNAPDYYLVDATTQEQYDVDSAPPHLLSAAIPRLWREAYEEGRRMDGERRDKAKEIYDELLILRQDLVMIRQREKRQFTSNLKKLSPMTRTVDLAHPGAYEKGLSRIGDTPAVLQSLMSGNAPQYIPQRFRIESAGDTTLIDEDDDVGDRTLADLPALEKTPDADEADINIEEVELFEIQLSRDAFLAQLDTHRGSLIHKAPAGFDQKITSAMMRHANLRLLWHPIEEGRRRIKVLQTIEKDAKGKKKKKTKFKCLIGGCGHVEKSMAKMKIHSARAHSVFEQNLAKLIEQGSGLSVENPASESGDSEEDDVAELEDDNEDEDEDDDEGILSLMNGNEDYDPDDDEDDSDDDDDTASDDNDDGPDDEPMELDGGEAGDTDDPMDAEESSTDDGVMVDPIDCPRCGHREDVPSLMREHMIKSCPARLVYILERPKGYHHTKKDKEEVPLLAALEGDPDRVLLLGAKLHAGVRRLLKTVDGRIPQLPPPLMHEQERSDGVSALPPKLRRPSDR